MHNRRSLLPPFLTVLSAGALLALGGCAHTEMGGVPSAEVADKPPIELVGLTVQPPDGSRILGNVSDLVIGPTNRVEQAIVTVGAPRFPTEHKVTINTADLRYARNRQAVILVGMTPEQFAALPAVEGNDRMMSMGGGAPASVGTAPTNWYGATQRR
ncbi:PRC-barrel domain containing protein [Azospirillum picis]|uniref:PRC-barrel domain containing protein n=1 Tax=Azospirillum picis TaxID=488438 RepID=A0ABU0MH03_9PROT|nr:PRC-barrel domain containing protein [Azospirillum picis]MBP2298313.1 hypothetical protein [Azospirillum picis]MDQ0532638.1 hypothetical protein [Azospirillum picis]